MRRKRKCLDPMCDVQGMSVTTAETETDYEDCNNYARAHVFSKCFKSLHTLLGFVLCFVLFLWILVFTLSLCRTPQRPARWFHSSAAVQTRIRKQSAKFFPSGCFSLIVSCHRQLNLYPKLLHISHREKGSFEVLSLQKRTPISIFAKVL